MGVALVGPHTGLVSEEPGVSLREAANRLGVHYQTAYRWVRAGDLPAAKVQGVYQVSDVDLADFATRRSHREPPPAERTVRSWDRFAAQMHLALIAGEEGKARAILEGLVADGIRLVDCCDNLLGPVLRRIGEEWRAGFIGIAEERRASGICGRLLGRLDPSPPGRPRGVAVVCTPPSDEHGLPGEMATAVLREDHWKVHHLGVGVPADDLVALVATIAPDLVVMSTVWPQARVEAQALAARMGGGPRVLVGRPGMTLGELVDLSRRPPPAGASPASR